MGRASGLQVGSQRTANGPLDRIRRAWSSYLAVSSERRWRAVYAECDGNGDGFIDRRELLVLLYRLGVEIPADVTLKTLFYKYDIDVSAPPPCSATRVVRLSKASHEPRLPARECALDRRMACSTLPNSPSSWRISIP